MSAPPQAYAFAAVIAVCLYLLGRDKRWSTAWRIVRAIILAGGIVGTGTAAVIGARKWRTPPSVAAVPAPVVPTDGGTDAGEQPHSMLAEPSEEEQRAVYDSIYRGGT